MNTSTPRKTPSILAGVLETLSDMMDVGFDDRSALAGYLRFKIPRGARVGRI